MIGLRGAVQRMAEKVEFIESYIKLGNEDYQWHDNHGELIRCGNCKYCYYASNRIPSEQTHACGKHGINVTQDWFCADGERQS